LPSLWRSPSATASVVFPLVSSSPGAPSVPSRAPSAPCSSGRFLPPRGGWWGDPPPPTHLCVLSVGSASPVVVSARPCRWLFCPCLGSRQLVGGVPPPPTSWPPTTCSCWGFSSSSFVARSGWALSPVARPSPGAASPGLASLLRARALPLFPPGAACCLACASALRRSARRGCSALLPASCPGLLVGPFWASWPLPGVLCRSRLSSVWCWVWGLGLGDF
jgi:hypothetical protein